MTSEQEPEPDEVLDGDHSVPVDLVELFEVIEWERLVGEETEEAVRGMEGLE